MIKYIKKIYNKTKKEFYELLSKNLLNNEKMFIVTANPETFMIAKDDNEFESLLLNEKITIVPDGVGVLKFANLLGYNVKEKIPGIEIVEQLFKEGNKQSKSIYLFGASKEVIEKLVDKLKNKYPKLNIVGYSDGYVFDKDVVFNKIIKLKPDIVLVALGIPNQEKLVYRYFNKFKKGIFVGVGGSFDVLSGYKKRAPKFFRKLNLEWLYRIIKEPKRIKRFSENNISFIFEVILIKFKIEKYRTLIKFLLIFFLIIILSFIIMLVTFFFSNKVIDLYLIKNYFRSPQLIFLSMLPFIIFISLLYLILGRLWLSYTIVAFITVLLATVNKFKLMYRDDPFLFEDLLLFREAAIMGEKYSYAPTFSMILIYIFLALISFLLYILVKKMKPMKLFKLIGTLILVVISIYLYNNVYLNEQIYRSIVDISNINIWSATHQ